MRGRLAGMGTEVVVRGLVQAVGNVCLGILDSGVVTPGGATTIIGGEQTDSV